MKTKFENGLKDKLQNFEPQGATSQWTKLSKELPKSIRPLWQNIILYTSAVAVIGTSAFFIFNPKDNDPQEKALVENTVVEDPVEVNSAETENEDPVVAPEEETAKQDSVSDNTETKTQPTHALQTESQDTDQYISETRIQEEPEPDTEKLTHSDSNEEYHDTSETSDKENGKPEETLVVNISINEGCVPLEIKFTTNADPANYEFMWHFKDGTRSTDVAPVHKYSDPGEYEAILILTPIKDNLQRQRLTSSTIYCYGIPDAKIDFEKSGNLYTFNTIDSGDIFYEWNIDQRKFITPLVDYEFKYDGLYDVKLKMTDSHGCALELSEEVNVIIEHNYEMPNAFTPGMTGINSYFGPVYEDMQDLSFTMIILDKYNQVVYETDDVNEPWDGINIRTNQDAEAGVYLWKIVTKDRYGNVRTRRGQVTLLRD